METQKQENAEKTCNIGHLRRNTKQKRILSDGMEYDYVKRGMSLLEAKKFLASKEGCKQEEYFIIVGHINSTHKFP